jgi:hypothetical protein
VTGGGVFFDLIPVYGGEFFKSNLFTGLIAARAISRSGPRALQAWSVLLLDMQFLLLGDRIE